MITSIRDFLDEYSTKINGVLHIGAHIGQEYILYAGSGIVNIAMFEPVPSTFGQLKQRIPTGAILHNVALGNENTEIEMHIETRNQGQSNSILTPKIHLIDYPKITFDDKITVNMVRLDDFLVDQHKYNFINIDVQGYELEVLKGASNLLHTIDYVACEVNRCELYDGGALVDDISSFLSEYGFKQIGIKWQTNSWGDAYYAK